jgi:ADP-heptose:LPS heptosyltransferase
MGLFQQQAPHKIAVLRPLQFGDLMCAVPALRALRTSFPKAEITLIGLPWSITFVDRFYRYLDKFLEFPGFPGFPEQSPQITKMPEFLSKAQAESFDLAIQMQGSGNLSNSIIALLGAKKTAGFSLEGMYCPDETTFMDYPVAEQEIWRLLRLVEFLELPLQGDYLEFPINEKDRQAFAALNDEFSISPAEYIVIHPGARAESRRWSPQKFAAVADSVADYGFTIVLTGTAEEKEITQDVANRMSHKAVNLTGRTDYGSLAALLSNARMLICNDTGVSHLSAALQVPSVVIFSDSEAERWGPLNQHIHKRVLWGSSAPPLSVLQEVDLLLQEDRSYAA